MEPLSIPSLSNIEVEQIVNSEHSDPFHVLGAHPFEPPTDNRGQITALAIRAFLPEAQQAWVIVDECPDKPVVMEQIHPDGVFQAIFNNQKELFSYHLRVLTH